MKFVEQTRFGAAHGNCYEACLASLTEIPLSEFGGEPWGEPWHDEPARHAHILETLFRHGWCALGEHRWGEHDDGVPGIVPVGPYILLGRMPNGVGHAVIAEGSRIIWVPHVGGDGLATADWFTIVLRATTFDWPVPWGPPPKPSGITEKDWYCKECAGTNATFETVIKDGSEIDHHPACSRATGD